MSHPDHPSEPERYEFDEPPRYRFEVARREFLRVAGAGLAVLVTVPAGSMPHQSGQAGQGRADANLAAWLHVDEKGTITAYTGKVEIGQNIRTSLAQAIADELRVPIHTITIVMADTDLTPYDAGTFGSQTTPRMSRQLARAAASAREILVDQAAARWQVDRQTLSVQNGRVTAPDGRSVPYGEITHGQNLTGAVAADAAPPPAWTHRGQPVRKVNGRAFVTGAHAFVIDMVRPGMVHGRIVRPAAIGASLMSLDESRAGAIAGVRIVRDGDFVGLTAADERTADRAVRAIRTEWRRRDGQPSAATIYAHLKQTSRPAGQALYSSGDAGRARSEATRLFETSYHIPYIAHVPLEPRAALAEWIDGRLTVWTATQRPFGVRSELARTFRIPEEHVRVIVPDMGSAYGGKHTGDVAVEAARLARGVGKPVKLVWTRAEEFAWAYFRPAGVIDVAAGVDASGTLISWEFDNWNSGSAAIRTPYEIPNQRIAFHEAESPLRQGSYRALAATANNHAREMHMDEIARSLGADALEFRLRHLKDERMRAVLAAAAEKAAWSKPRTGGGTSLGVACGTEKGSYVAAVAELARTPDAFDVVRFVVAFECGAIVNPDGLRNQVEGALVQGLGGALFEAIDFRDGAILNGTMAQYRVPRFKDVPRLEIVLLDRKDLPSAGAGETPIVCVAPAIGSAARAFGPVRPALPVTLQVARTRA